MSAPLRGRKGRALLTLPILSVGHEPDAPPHSAPTEQWWSPVTPGALHTYLPEEELVYIMHIMGAMV